jgi:DNA polymerase-3 subunit delta
MAVTAGQKELHQAIENRAFDPAYLFVGDDDFRKNEALTRLLESAVDPATRDFNLEMRRGSEIGAEALGSILGTPPMLAERRVVVVRDAAALKKDAKTVAEKYLDAPSPDVILVLLQGAGEKADPRFEKATAVVFEPIAGPRLAKWIAQRAETAFHASIDPAAVDLLQASVGNDLSQLNVELEKLASYVNGKPIDEAAVSAIVGLRREETLPALLDAIGDRNAAESLRILPGLLQQPKTSGVFIVMALGMQILGTGFARARVSRRAPSQRIESELFAMLKEGGGSPGRSWTDAVRSWVRYASKWNETDLLAAAGILHAADRSLKDTGRTSEEGILQTAILAMCQPAARAAA